MYRNQTTTVANESAQRAELRRRDVWLVIVEDDSVIVLQDFRIEARRRIRVVEVDPALCQHGIDRLGPRCWLVRSAVPEKENLQAVGRLGMQRLALRQRCRLRGLRSLSTTTRRRAR